MTKKKTLGNNPLEAYFASSSKSVVTQEEQRRDVGFAPASGSKKQRITIHLPIDLIEKIKNVVYWEPGLTLTALAQEAFEKAVQKLEEKRGGLYPDRKDRVLRGGRPMS
jgi:hypothetical protein